jgi:hypothetical protein
VWHAGTIASNSNYIVLELKMTFQRTSAIIFSNKKQEDNKRAYLKPELRNKNNAVNHS